MADQVVPDVEVGDVQSLGDVVHVEVGRLLAVLQVEVGEHRHLGSHRVQVGQVGQPGVTELPAGGRERVASRGRLRARSSRPELVTSHPV